ncbi:MAG: hypothetical protein M9936_23890 [Caldilinea sp.]|nr:hypothetical protein [Caldilinea sp.]MCO5212752.1 hypothetical protein [Caldilinea sp.]
MAIYSRKSRSWLRSGVRWRSPRLAGIALWLAVIAALAGFPAADSAPGGPVRPAPPVRPAVAAAASMAAPVGNAMPIVAESTLTELAPAVAYNGDRDEYLVVWYNDRPGNDDIGAQRVDGDGKLLGGPFYIAAGSGVERRNPAVAYSSGQQRYLVVYEHDDGTYARIYGRIIGGDGQVLGVEFPLSSGAALKNCFTPAIGYASTADTFLIVWQRTVVASTVSDIEAQLANGDGSLSGANFFVQQGSSPFSHSAPALAYNRARNEFLVVWARYDSGASLTDIYGRLVTGNGQPLQPTSIEYARMTVSNTKPAVAALPTASPIGQYLIIWELHYAAGDRDIYGRTAAGDGTPDPGFYLGGANVDESRPAVMGSEGRQIYFAVWQRPDVAPLAFEYIYYRRIEPTGTAIGGDAWLLGSFAARPALANGGAGDIFVVAEDKPLLAEQGIYGQLWGDRTYLPAILKP